MKGKKYLRGCRPELYKGLNRLYASAASHFRPADRASEHILKAHGLSIYFDRIWNDFTATPSKPDEATRNFYAAT